MKPCTQFDPPNVDHILARIPDEWRKYLDIGPGWYQLVIDLDAKLAAIDAHYILHQCKEKFGGLRYYTAHRHAAYNAFNAEIRAAEVRAASTCEQCGGAGSLRNKPSGWLVTLCDEHAGAAILVEPEMYTVMSDEDMTANSMPERDEDAA